MGNILRLRAGRDTHSTIAYARTADAQHGVRTNHALPRDSLYPLPLPPAAEEACAVWNARSRAPPAAAHLGRLVRRSPTHAALSSPPTTVAKRASEPYQLSPHVSSRRVSEANQQRGAKVGFFLIKLFWRN